MKFQVGRFLCEMSLDDHGGMQARRFLRGGRKTEPPTLRCDRYRLPCWSRRRWSAAPRGVDIGLEAMQYARIEDR
jgi:hypothetical protein